MKGIRRLFIGIFFILLFLPLIFFNRKSQVVSKIDNRELREDPFKTEEGETLQESIESYVDDRIGMRDKMIEVYTTWNATLFHEMVHPTYAYGKDGYVFFKPSNKIDFQDYHVRFAEMVAKLQEYCEERNVPFLFAFEPSKMSVLREELPEGYCYNNDWVPMFFDELNQLGVYYVDNTPLMCEKEAEGEAVFNKVYDAGHWNDLGAFYGVNHILEALAEQQENIHINTKDEFEIGTKKETSLLVSEFKIDDEVPVFTRKSQIIDKTEEYDSQVERDERFPYFEYTENPEREKEGAPKVLVFQGSYMNEYGAKFFENSFGQYIAVHNYQNVMNMDYYFKMFQPDCVIFEVTEYTVLDDYFSYGSMVNMELK